MTFLLRITVVAITLAFVTNEANASASVPINGHVYLIRGLFGEVFSRGLDQLARNINKRGLHASVHGLPEVNSLTDEIIRKYKDDPSSAPLILIGHSSGGDAIISMAQKMKKAKVPVGLAFSFDPTRRAGPVPDNVEVFINLFQKTNPIGGGQVKAAFDFRGRLVNVDLREHNEIKHITLDKSSKIRELVVDEIIGFARFSSKKETDAHVDVSPKGKKPKQHSTDGSTPNLATPLYMKYVIPRDEPIELWDSGLRTAVRAEDDLQTIAARYGAPAWAIAQINKIRDDARLQTGMALTIPLRLYQFDAASNTR
jgi:hypothetical protein